MTCSTCHDESPAPPALTVTSVWFTAGQISLRYADGKTVRRPIRAFARLARASHAERMDFEIHGTRVHWPALDEDIDAVSFLGFAGDLLAERRA